MANPRRNSLLNARTFFLRTSIVLSFVLIPFFTMAALAQQNYVRKEIDSPGLVIEAVAGWGGYVDRMTAVPLSFLIRNDTERNIEGVLRLTERTNGHQAVLGDVVVSPGTTRRFTSIQSLNDWFDCSVTFSQGEKILWRRDLDLVTGKSFDTNVNYLLFVDENARRLDLPGDQTDTSTMGSYEFQVASFSGRQTRCLSAKPWQLPNHPGPLLVTMAIVFHENSSERELNQAQWKAVAEWMCQGGTIFVHQRSPEIINRLVELSPLSSETAIDEGAFTVRRFGLGAIYEYHRPLMTSERIETRQSIAAIAANLTRNHINTFTDSGPVNFGQVPTDFVRASQADRNRNLFITLFGFYTVLSGLVTLLLFRLSQKQIAAYVVTIVIGTSIVSALLGGYMRISKGDLRWLTLTEPGVGGLVQVAAIDVQSAGSRTTRVAIQGEHADLQFIGTSRQYYMAPRRAGYSPFTWQPNLAANESETYQIIVPMSPWGQRRCHANAFHREPQRLEIDLHFEPSSSVEEDEQPESAATPAGSFSVKLDNRLPFEIKDCWLVVGVTCPAGPNAGKSNRPNRPNRPRKPGNRPRSPQVNAKPVDGMIDLYHMERLPNLPRGENRQVDFEANFQDTQYNWEMAQFWPHGSLIPPRISRMGDTNAWIIARIDQSPIMQIDQQRSDFILQESIHLFIQEIPSEDMPKTLQFINAVETPGADLKEPAKP